MSYHVSSLSKSLDLKRAEKKIKIKEDPEYKVKLEKCKKII